jgi:hypothetical protein
VILDNQNSAIANFIEIPNFHFEYIEMEIKQLARSAGADDQIAKQE